MTADGYDPLVRLWELVEDDLPASQIEAWVHDVYVTGELALAIGNEAALELIAIDFRHEDIAKLLRTRARELAVARHPDLAVWLRARHLSRGMLDGIVDIVDGCHAIARLRDPDPSREDGPIPVCFLGWSSEFDDIPGTRVRPLWEPRALAERMEKLEAYRGDVLAELRVLASRLDVLIAGTRPPACVG